MALTEDRFDSIKGESLNETRIPVATTKVIFIGALVSADGNGKLEPVEDDVSQANKSIGVALEGFDNTTGADGDGHVIVMLRGVAILPAGGVLVEANVLKTIHATDDNTTALTSSNGRILGTLDKITDNQAFVRIG